MKKERNPRPPRKMNPIFLVFCEGETEEAYVNFLRQKYRLPVKVIAHITGLALSADRVKSYARKEQEGVNGEVTSFLMYDLDIQEMAGKIASCRESVSIASNPSVELWFLLHTSEHHAAISTDACIKKLIRSSPDWEHYQKGSLSERQKNLLWDSRASASGRARQLSDGENPSSLVYRLIEAMESVNRQR